MFRVQHKAVAQAEELRNRVANLADSFGSSVPSQHQLEDNAYVASLDFDERETFWNNLLTDDVLYTIQHFAADVIHLHATFHQQNGQCAVFFR